MYILSIAISGNTRFKLANIKEFKVDFTNLIQVIIGTNGSGKSALVSELSPLPPSSSDYLPGGYKDIIIAHRGKTYRAVSMFHPTHHSFEVDGENLNVSGKETEQKKLVKDHFGLTPSLFKLLIGETKFSALSSQARRDWLMSISGMNFEYAMRLFQAAKDKHKEATILTNNMAEREVAETEKLKEIGDVEPLRVEAHQLKDKLNRLMRMTTTDHIVSVNKIQSMIDDNLHSIQTHTQGYLRQLEIDHPTLSNYPTLSDFIAYNNQLDGQLKANSHKLKELYRKKESLTELAKRAVTEGMTLDQARDEIKTLENQLYQVSVNDYPYFFYELNIDRTEVERYKDDIAEAINAYVSNADLKFNSDYMQTLTNKLNSLHQELVAANSEQHKLEHALKYHLDQPLAECPTCKTEFQINDAAKQASELTIRLSEVVELRDSLDKLKQGSEGDRFEMQEYLDARRNLHAKFNGATNQVFQKLRDEIIEVEKTGTNSRGLLAVLESWMTVIVASYRYKDIRVTLEEKQHLLVHLEDIERLKREYEGIQLSDIDIEIDDLYNTVKRHQAEYEANGEVIRSINLVLKGLPKLTQELESLESNVRSYETALVNNMLNETISELQSSLAGIEAKISKVDSINHSIANLQKYRSSYADQEKYAKKLLEMLSPNKGLIAEYVMSFLNDFIGKLNSLVGEVWEYDMEVLACKLDGAEVDYRFPVKLAGDTKMRKDIVETSKGQLSFINLAFRLAIISTLDDTTFPLYLDEEGEGLDEQHTENLVRFIKNYTEAGAAEQVFIISHDFAGHASFQHAETLALCTKNVKNLPARYNGHAAIAYN